MNFFSISHEDGRPNKIVNLDQIRLIDHETRRIHLGDTLILSLDDVSFRRFLDYLMGGK